MLSSQKGNLNPENWKHMMYVIPEEKFLHSFLQKYIRGLNDLFTENLSSLFMLFGWSSISNASLHLNFLARMLAGVVQQDTMGQISAVFCHSQPLSLIGQMLSGIQ
jgi:hypothetical protein